MSFQYSFENDDQYTVNMLDVDSREAEHIAGQQQHEFNLRRRNEIEAAHRNNIVSTPQQERPRFQTNIPPQIFVGLSGGSMMFYIPPGEPRRRDYVDLILRHGGMVRDNPDNSFTLGQHEVFSLDFIDACIEQGKMVPIGEYLNLNVTEETSMIDPRIEALDQEGSLNEVTDSRASELAPSIDSHHEQQFQPSQLPQLPQSPQQPQQQQPQQQQQQAPPPPPPPQQRLIQQQKSNQVKPSETNSSSPEKSTIEIKRPATNRFTEEQDEFILESVRRNPRLRNSHSFYDELAKAPSLQNHTKNSIRSRYRRTLSRRLFYVYKTDDYDRLVKDKNGQNIRVGIEESGGTLKNKFTAEDDYHLCCIVKAYGKAVYSVFSELYRKRPNHSINSWRDRYRKFVGEGDVEAFIEYYEKKINLGETPQGLGKVIKGDKKVTSKNVNNNSNGDVDALPSS